MTGKFNKPVHSKGLVSKRREWKQVGNLSDVSSFRKMLTGAVPVFAVAFCAAFAASSILTPTKSSDAANKVTANISSDGYYVKINSSDVTLNLTSTPSGSMTVANSVVKASTNAPSGYKLYLGMADTKSDGTEKTAAEKLLTGLYLDENLSSSSYVPAVDADSTAPAALTNSTWGYAVDSASTGAPSIWADKSHSAMESATPTSDVFAEVPAFGSEDLIQETSSANTSIAEEDWQESYWEDSTKYTAATLWYGVRANMSVASGAYANTIAYTAIAQASPTPAGELGFSPVSYARGVTYETTDWADRTLAITTSLMTSTSMEPGDATVTVSGGPLNRTDSCEVTNVSVVPFESGATSGNVVVTCTLPKEYAGTYDITVNLTKFGQSYTSTYDYTVDWDTISAMQEMTSSVCASADTPTTTTYPVPEKYLTDLRGGGGHITGSVSTGYTYQAAQTGKYRIRKLADGNCWMTENMDLAMSTTTTYHSYDTNVAADWTPSTNTITAATGTATTNTRTVDMTYRGVGSQGTTTAVTLASTYAGQSIAAETQHIGTYYDWAAAIANNTDYTTADTSVSTSICPKGWTLPNGGDSSTSKSFAYLTNKYGLTNSQAGSEGLRSYPLSFVFSGYYYWGDGKLYRQGARGDWWSSTVNSETNSRDLGVNSTELYPQSNNDKLGGFGVRCVSL